MLDARRFKALILQLYTIKISKEATILKNASSIFYNKLNENHC